MRLLQIYTLTLLSTLFILYSQAVLAEEGKPSSQTDNYYENSPFKIPSFNPEKIKSKVDFSIGDLYDEPIKSKPIVKEKKANTDYAPSKIKVKPQANKVTVKKKELEKTLDKLLPQIFKKPSSATKTSPVVKKEKNLPKSLGENYGKAQIEEDTNKLESFFDKYGYEENKSNRESAVSTITKTSDSFNSKSIFFKPSLVVRRTPIIVIDPGHGGKDPGALGKLGTKEKQVVLSYSIALKRLLQKSGKYKVVMTRYGDKYVGLKNRVKIAQRAKGDIMISVHADSHPNRRTKGFSVYTISKNRAAREAKKLVKQADYKEVISGVKLKGESSDVKEALIDFAQKETKDISDEFSKILAKKLGQKVKPLKRTNREGSLAVLTGADVPSVLLELGYLSNREEEKNLRNKRHQKKIVTAIKAAIDEYFDKYSYMLEERN